MAKAVVLLSSYNGEKYIKAQIDSILNQTMADFELIIRDDGSTDGTRDILAEYESIDNRISIILDDQNLGYPACFYYLTDHAPEAEYYFFADQDDVWFEDKLERAISYIESNSTSDEPVAYYARYRICDGALCEKSTSPIVKPLSFTQSLFEVNGLEFTMCINHTALVLLNANKPSFCTGRGTWMSMLYSAMGKVLCDDYICALYRRHESAVTSSNMSTIGMFVWRIKNFFNGGFDDYNEILCDFNSTIGPKLDQKLRRQTHLFSRTKYFPYAITKAFFPKRLRRKLLDDIAIRFCFIIGRL